MKKHNNFARADIKWVRIYATYLFEIGILNIRVSYLFNPGWKIVSSIFIPNSKFSSRKMSSYIIIYFNPRMQSKNEWMKRLRVVECTGVGVWPQIFNTAK